MVSCSQPNGHKLETVLWPCCCDLEQITLFPLLQCTNVPTCKIGTWLQLGVAKRAVTPSPIDSVDLGWSSWTSGANTTPEVPVNVTASSQPVSRKLNANALVQCACVTVLVFT